MPMNAAARAVARAQSPEDLARLDRQCAAWPLHYIVEGPQSAVLWPPKRLHGSVLAWNIGGVIDRYPSTNWIDGRSPPGAQAAHSPGGFNAESMYPECIRKVQQQYKRPQGYCTLDSCGAQPNERGKGSITYNVDALKCRQDNN
jgi:hypothetical protein